MAKRSLKVSEQKKEKVKRAFDCTGWTQQQLAQELCYTRQPIGKFLKGESVNRNHFIEICEKLDLDWQEIADLPKNDQLESSEENHDNNSDVDALVQEVRKKVCPSIQEKCGTMRVLDMSQPIGLNDIYTEVNILEKITASRRREIAELMEGFDAKNFDRVGLGKITEARVPGLKAVEKHLKLIVLGKPGAGKTTFLKHLAIQCSCGQFQGNRVPIFITLKDFAETEEKPCLVTYTTQMLASYNIKNQFEQLLMDGRVLVLFDGLDEVRKEDNNRVLNQIRGFSEQYHANQFVMTCRIAAKEYTFERFTEVEVADFNDQQIGSFSRKWFEAKEPSKAERLMEKLRENQPIKELATNPLLLTLLCLVFEERANFPSNRSELYKEGLDVLLKKWDGKRNIERDEVYKKLSLKGKEDLLSQIALITFERGDYFFKQKELEQHIADYIRNLPEAKTDPEALQLDSEAVLKSIEAQHGLLVERARGIYSFSHLTFQEYFTAKKITTSSNPQALEKDLQNLVSHIAEKRWREVFLLTSGMLQPADYFLNLMKQQIDGLVADEKLQNFLRWVNRKSESVNVSYKTAAVRAFYYDMLDRSLALALDHDLTHDCNFGRERDLALALDRALNLSVVRVSTRIPEVACDVARDISRALNRHLDFEPELKQTLQQLQKQLPNQNSDENKLKQWWKDKGKNWTKQLRDVMIEHRDIGHDWQFSKEQKKLLRQYYDANKLLVDCFNSDCYVNREIRSDIEKNLLLPLVEIERNKKIDLLHN